MAGVFSAGAASDGRIDGFEERKAMEVHVPRIDSLDSVLPHKDRCLGIIEEVASQEGRFLDDVCCYFEMPWGGNQEAEGG